MKALVVQPMVSELHHFTLSDMKRQCLPSENWKKLHPSILVERRDGKTVTKSPENSRKLCKRQLVNQWLTLKRKASTLPVVSSHTCSSGGSSRDVNGSHDVQLSKHQDHAVDAGELPSDPRLWSPYDVTAWLSRMEESHGLDVDHSFFQMNGRGLCLMPLKGFLFRVPDHGGLLYEDFRGRLRKCLLMPGDKTSGPTANKRTESTAHRGGATSQSGCETAQWPLPPVAKCGEVVVAEETSVPDFKGRVSPLTYHTL